MRDAICLATILRSRRSVRSNSVLTLFKDPTIREMLVIDKQGELALAGI